VGHEVVVLHRGEDTRPLDVAADELADAGVIERPLAAREDPPIIDQVVDDGLGVRPIDLGRGDEVTELRVGRGRSRSLVVAGEVLIRMRDSTRSGESSASSWVIPPPAETPTRCAADIPKPSSTPFLLSE
jgi:hypothetical protein